MKRIIPSKKEKREYAKIPHPNFEEVKRSWEYLSTTTNFLFNEFGLSEILERGDTNIVFEEEQRLKHQNRCLRAMKILGTGTPYNQEHIKVRSELYDVLDQLKDYIGTQDLGKSLEIYTYTDENVNNFLVNTNHDLVYFMMYNILDNTRHAFKDNQNKKLKVDMSLKEVNDEYEFKIQDYGKGISKSDLEKITDDGFTTNHKHKGIGLSSVFQIVNLLDARLEIESTLWKGSSFSLYLAKDYRGWERDY